VVTFVTAAQRRSNRTVATFSDLPSILASHSGPFIVEFGTGWGLAEEVFEAADWILEPIDNDTGYNHLSVRAAAAIVVDRLGRVFEGAA